MEEFIEIEDVGRGVNHRWGFSGIMLSFGRHSRSWTLSQGRSNPEWFADEREKER